MPYKDPDKYREHQRGYQRQRRETQRAAMGRRKVVRGCDECGYDKNPAALQWHHRDRADKKGQVSWMLSLSKDRLEAEIAKCDLLCANCHAEREWPA